MITTIIVATITAVVTAVITAKVVSSKSKSALTSLAAQNSSLLDRAVTAESAKEFLEIQAAAYAPRPKKEWKRKWSSVLPRENADTFV